MNVFKIFMSLIVVVGSLLIFNGCYEEAKAISKTNQPTEKLELQWHTIQDLEALQKKSPKKVLVDVYTDWCYWCKVMDQKTFSNASIIEYLKEDYHLVKLNAEDKNAIPFKGKTYNYVPTKRRGYHELAQTLLKGNLSYPSFVVLDEELKVVDVSRGFKDAVAFKEHLSKISMQ